MNELRVMGNGERLDKLLTLGKLSRSQAASLIRQGQATVNGNVVIIPSFRAKTGDEVVLHVPMETEIIDKGENIPLDILYQDAHLAVVVKPHGMVVHPAAGNERGTLVNALLHHLDSLSSVGGQRRPGIVHRLDKDTSGLMVVAKNDKVHLHLSRQLAERKMEKLYLAVVAGRMKEVAGEVDLPIGRSQRDRKKMAVRPEGRAAQTQWHLVEQRPASALIAIRLITGRTHQIRVHMAALHHPVLGDPLYGHRSMPPAPRLMLHAWRLRFTHPVTGEEIRCEAPPEVSFGLPRAWSQADRWIW